MHIWLYSVKQKIDKCIQCADASGQNDIMLMLFIYFGSNLVDGIFFMIGDFKIRSHNNF